MTERPNDVVFLHTDNLHPFAVVMTVTKEKLGIDKETGDILEVKMPDKKKGC